MTLHEDDIYTLKGFILEVMIQDYREFYIEDLLDYGGNWEDTAEVTGRVRDRLKPHIDNLDLEKGNLAEKAAGIYEQELGIEFTKKDYIKENTKRYF